MAFRQTHSMVVMFSVNFKRILD